MGKQLRIWGVTLLAAAFLFVGSVPGSADPTLEEIRLLLQKGLNLAELDQEIARLSGQEIRLGEKIIATESQIEDSKVQVAKTREHAGKVIRAYYMGERMDVWTMILSSNSFADALAVYEYYNMIVQNDFRKLTAYSDSYKSLAASREELLAEQKELTEIKTAFIAQREKAAMLQQDIESSIAVSADAAALRAELDRFTQEWKEKGVPLFRKYLSSISEAMQSLPELLTGNSGDKYVKELNLVKRSMLFEISDADLTTFLRSKNPLFENITFKFEKGSFQAFGQEQGTALSITGRYVVDNTDGNKLLFHVDELTYNGFVLPETSNRALEQEFDLGFTPSRFMSGIEATEVTMQDSMLRLGFKLN